MTVHPTLNLRIERQNRERPSKAAARERALQPVPSPHPDAPDAAAVRRREAEIDAMLSMSFPASDPPSWTL